VLRILHVIPSLDYNAAARQLTLLAPRLPRDRFDVRVAVLQTAGPWADQLRKDGVRVDILGWTRLIDPRPFRGLRRCLAEFQPDVLHVWRLSGLRWAVLVGGWARRRVVVSMPFAAVDGGYNLGWLDRALLARADRVVAWGPFEAERYRRMGVPGRKVAVIPPGVEEPAEPAAAPDLRAGLGLQDAARLVVGVGPLEAQKGFRDAIWALELVHHLCGDLHLVLVGGGPDRRRLERFTKLIQATARIHFAGPRPDLPGILAESEVVWAPDRAGGSVNTVLEAMAAGKPVVASRLPSLAEVVVEGETGYLVPHADKAALARRTRQLLDDSQKRQQLGEAGRRRVRDKFNAAEMARRFTQLYQEP
jgi:glycosyltransferase involved in cell wall biosynthesis